MNCLQNATKIKHLSASTPPMKPLAQLMELHSNSAIEDIKLTIIMRALDEKSTVNGCFRPRVSNAVH